MQEVYKIINDISKNSISPAYILCGDEPYFVDKIIETAEETFVDNKNTTYDKHVFYGSEVNWQNLVNLCGQFSMFGDKQFVLVKNAEFKKEESEILANYLLHSAPHTILMISLKSKIDKRSRLYKVAQKHSVFVETKKIYDNQIPKFVSELIQKKGWECNSKEVYLISDHIGNNLSRIEKELDKFDFLIPENGELTMDLIEKYIGISKEYNNFEWIDAIAAKNISKIVKLAIHFGKDPKNYPFMLSINLLYTFFTQLMLYHTLANKSKENTIKSLGVSFMAVDNLQKAHKNYSLKQVTKILTIIHHYFKEAVGIDSTKDEKSKFLALCLEIVS